MLREEPGRETKVSNFGGGRPAPCPSRTRGACCDWGNQPIEEKQNLLYSPDAILYSQDTILYSQDAISYSQEATLYSQDAIFWMSITLIIFILIDPSNDYRQILGVNEF